MWSALAKLIRPIWDFISKAVLPIITLIGTLLGFFRETPEREQAIKDPNLLAGAIQDAIDQVDYNEVPVDFVYDKRSQQLVDYQQNAKGFMSNQLDDDARRAFGDKKMIEFVPRSHAAAMARSASAPAEYTSVEVDI